MAAVRGHVIWKIKEGKNLNLETLSFFSPGGFTFTHKSGENVSFDFLENVSGFTEENQYIESNLRDLDEDFVSLNIENKNLIQENYSTDFFKDGYIDLSNGKDEIYCCMDVIEDGKVVYEVDFNNYIQPVYMAVYDPCNLEAKAIELYSKLSEEEYKLLFRA